MLTGQGQACSGPGPHCSHALILSECPQSQKDLRTPGMEGAGRKFQGSGTEWSQKLGSPQLTPCLENYKEPRTETGLGSQSPALELV